MLWFSAIKQLSFGYIPFLCAAVAGSYYYSMISVQSYISKSTTEPAGQHGIGNTQPEPAKQYKLNNYDMMLVLGDSITERGYEVNTSGYLALLANLYRRQMDIMNRGFAGYNSLQALEIAPAVLPKTMPFLNKRSKHPNTHSSGTRPTSKDSTWQDHDDFSSDTARMQILAIFLGANDARLPGNVGAIPVEQYRNNIHAIISLVWDPQSENYAPETRILIITPPPIGELMVQEHEPNFAAKPLVFNNYTRLYAEMAKQVADEAGVPSIDFYTEIENRVREEQANGSWSEKYDGYDNYLIDGVHLNSKGNKVLSNLILKTLKSIWPEMLPKTLQS